MMSDVFISHAHDGLQRIRPIVAVLSGAGVRIASGDLALEDCDIISVLGSKEESGNGQ